MKSLLEHLNQVELEARSPQQGDVFDFEIQGSELVESYVIETHGDNIVVAGDTQLVKVLSEMGCVLETIGRYGAVGKGMGTGFVVDNANSNDPLLAKSMDDMAVPAMEGVMSEIAVELGEIADSEDFDALYDLMTGRSPAGQMVQKIADDIAAQYRLYDDDHEELLSRVMDYIVDQYGGQLDEAEYQGRKVPLGKPMRGDVRKFKVYVKDPSTGNIKKVNFGDPDMRIKKSNPKRRKSFRARHRCDNPGPRTKARYWSCRMW